MGKITINKEQKLYVFEHGNGNSYTCLGFDVCEERKARLAAELGEPIKKHRKGTLAAYNEYKRLTDIVAYNYHHTGWRSQSELIPEFIGNEGRRVEVITSYGEKQRYTIGKSTGFIPCHIEIKTSRSSGGSAVTGYPFKKLTFLS